MNYLKALAPYLITAAMFYLLGSYIFGTFDVTKQEPIFKTIIALLLLTVWAYITIYHKPPFEP